MTVIVMIMAIWNCN